MKRLQNNKKRGKEKDREEEIERLKMRGGAHSLNSSRLRKTRQDEKRSLQEEKKKDSTVNEDAEEISMGFWQIPMKSLTRYSKGLN